MIGINYGQEFPWDRILPSEEVFMVDFSLQPFEEMWRLNNCCILHWIDHHATAIRDFKLYPEMGKEGRILLKDGMGACELTWEYLFPLDEIPLAVHWLGRYDVWDHSDVNVLPFQYGMRQFDDTRPGNQELWSMLLKRRSGMTIPIKNDGRLLMNYEAAQNTKFCRAYAFETVLKQPLSLMEREGDLAESTHREFPAICANRGFTNSKVFDSVYDPEKHDLMITFCRLKPPAGEWTVSLYSTKPETDCGEIARTFGGGGHKGAAGFQCLELPFEY
jgi:hypothetical protein